MASADVTAARDALLAAAQPSSNTTVEDVQGLLGTFENAVRVDALADRPADEYRTARRLNTNTRQPENVRMPVWFGEWEPDPGN